MDMLWAELLNSDWHDYLGSGRSEDRLENVRWRTRFLARWNLPPHIIDARTTRTALRELRSLLRRLLDAVLSAKPPRDLEALNAYFAAEPVVRRVERSRDAAGAYRLRLDPVRRTFRAALAEIATSFAEVLVEGDLTRIKLCENSDCRWVFYDRTRSRTRRWCEGPTGCGNLLKVRRFRERQKKKRTGTGQVRPRRKQRRN